MSGVYVTTTAESAQRPRVGNLWNLVLVFSHVKWANLQLTTFETQASVDQSNMSLDGLAIPIPPRIPNCWCRFSNTDWVSTCGCKSPFVVLSSWVRCFVIVRVTMSFIGSTFFVIRNLMSTCLAFNCDAGNYPFR